MFELFLIVGFWVLVLVYLMFIHVIVLSLISTLFIAPFNLLKLGASGISYAMVIGNMIGAILLFWVAYNQLWILNFGEPAPLLFYLFGLFAAYMGSGTSEVEANTGNKLMTSGEVTGILICLVMAFINETAFI